MFFKNGMSNDSRNLMIARIVDIYINQNKAQTCKFTDAQIIEVYEQSLELKTLNDEVSGTLTHLIPNS